MKKHIYILLIVVILLTSSCSFFQTKQEVPPPTEQEAVLEKESGLVQSSQDLNISSAPAKFALISDTQEHIFIDSVQINLAKYQRRNVEVSGLWNDEKTVFLVEDITSLGNELQIKAQYQSEEMGIKFQYPSIWFVESTKNSLGQSKLIITPYKIDADDSTAVDTITVDQLSNSKKVSVSQWLELDDKYQPTDPTATGYFYQQSLLGAGQMDAVKKTAANSSSVDFYIARDSFIYNLSHTTVGDSDKDMYRNAFYDILASFEFIPFGQSPPKTTQITKPDEKAPAVPPVQLPPVQPVAPVVPTTPVTETPAPSADVTSARTEFINYIKTNIGSLAPEAPSEGGTWTVTSIQFAYPEGSPDAFNAVYVIYKSAADLRKILLSVGDRTKPESLTRVAYFKPGEFTDWAITEGTDTAKNAEKADITVTGPSSSEVVIKSGMSLLDARSLKIQIQYPSKWYWAVSDGGYNFSTKPVTADNVVVRLVKGDAPQTLGSLTADDLSSVCVEKSTKYCLVGDRTLVETMSQMSLTITE